jgi:pyruvate ferredoxin oxidoreductase gamma subunit
MNQADGLTEVVWHGRGGQGAFTAARLLAASYIAGGGDRYALAFPSFGPERRGAPVRAFTKLSESEVNSRNEITCADFTVYLDSTLFRGTS